MYIKKKNTLTQSRRSMHADSIGWPTVVTAARGRLSADKAGVYELIGNVCKRRSYDTYEELRRSRVYSHTDGYLSFIGPGEGARPRSGSVSTSFDRCEGLRIADHALALRQPIFVSSNARDQG